MAQRRSLPMDQEEIERLRNENIKLRKELEKSNALMMEAEDRADKELDAEKEKTRTYRKQVQDFHTETRRKEEEIQQKSHQINDLQNELDSVKHMNKTMDSRYKQTQADLEGKNLRYHVANNELTEKNLALKEAERALRDERGKIKQELKCLSNERDHVKRKLGDMSRSYAESVRKSARTDAELSAYKKTDNLIEAELVKRRSYRAQIRTVIPLFYPRISDRPGVVPRLDLCESKGLGDLLQNNTCKMFKATRTSPIDSGLSEHRFKDRKTVRIDLGDGRKIKKINRPELTDGRKTALRSRGNDLDREMEYFMASDDEFPGGELLANLSRLLESATWATAQNEFGVTFAERITSFTECNADTILTS